MVFYEPPPPPCSTLADCLLRRAATLGRTDTVALMLAHGARLDFDVSVLEYDTCLGTPLVNACEAGTVSAALLRASDAQRKATKRASEPSVPSGSRRVYMCTKCGEPKKGHVCRAK